MTIRDILFEMSTETIVTIKDDYANYKCYPTKHDKLPYSLLNKRVLFITAEGKNEITIYTVYEGATP